MILYRKSNQISKNKYMLRAVIVIIYLISILVYSHNRGSYFRMIEIMNIVFIGSITLMTNNKYSKNDNNLSVSLGSGLIVLIVLYIMKFMIYERSFYNDLRPIENTILDLCGVLINFSEILIIIVSTKMNNYKNQDKLIIKNFLILAGTIIGIVILSSNLQDYNDNIKKFYYETGLNYIIMMALYGYCYISIFNNRKNINKNQMGTLILFLNILFLSDFLGGFASTISNDGTYVQHRVICYGLNYFAYYFLYEGFITNSLENYYKDLHKHILEREENIKQKNIILKKRTSLLKELNLLVEKSKNHHNEFINSINDFIHISKGGKTEYINDSALNLISETFDRAYLIEKLNEFYINVMKVEIDEHKSSEHKFQLSLIDKFDEIINLELFHISLKDDYVFLLIKNITAEKRLKEKREYLEKYYEEEYLKSEFFSNISHELRTPINVISSAIQLNEINIAEGNLEKVKENNDRIRNNSLRLIRTINNFIDVNRLSENYLSGEYKFYNIVDLVETVLHCSKTYFYKKEMNFLFDTEEEEIFVKIDRTFTERIILNILSNCVKYGNNKGNVYIYINLIDNRVEINIENDGKLIEEKEKAYIFDKFTKNNKSLNRNHEGSGLGLYISKGLMELQNGSLEMRTDENNKNRFILTFKKIDLDYIEEDINVKNMSYSDIYISDLKERVDIEFSDIYL